MDFKEVLTSSSFSLHLASDTKDGIIAELVDLIAADGHLKDRDDALRAVYERERKISTGLQDGVAVPHGKTRTVKSMVTAFGLKKEGIDFDSLDGLPARIFILTISPANKTGPHIEYLSAVSRILQRESARQRLLEAGSVEEVIRILTG